MCASVVLPRPGGTKRSTWSSASPRPRAAWMRISNWPRILSWPTYSASVAGRSERSICSSCTEEGLAEMRRSVSTAIGASYVLCDENFFAKHVDDFHCDCALPLLGRRQLVASANQILFALRYIG